MKKLAIFDMDGTLFNTNDVNFNAYNEALKEKGFSVDYNYYCEYCNGKHYKTFIPKLVNYNNETIEYVHSRKKQLYNKYLDKAKINIHLFNIIDLIKEEYNISLVTTASKENTEQILKHFDKYNIFDLIITGDDIKKTKPDPEGFNKAIEYFNCDIKDVIIFEDSADGLKAAIATGAIVFTVNKF